MHASIIFALIIHDSQSLLHSFYLIFNSLSLQMPCIVYNKCPQKKSDF